MVCPGREDITVFLSVGQRSFTPRSVGNWDTGPYFAGLMLVDFNLDGRPDLAISQESSDTVTVFLGDGEGDFAEAAYSPMGVSGEWE